MSLMPELPSSREHDEVLLLLLLLLWKHNRVSSGYSSSKPRNCAKPDLDSSEEGFAMLSARFTVRRLIAFSVLTRIIIFSQTAYFCHCLRHIVMAASCSGGN